MSRTTRALGLLLGLSLLIAACGKDDKASTADTPESSSTDSALTVGFIYVGPKDDFGYNQAAYQGSLDMKKAYPDVKVLQAENVPETAEAEGVMQDMIDKGAKLIFATSYGHLEFARNLAEQNPDVVFVHQGGLEGDDKLDNLGTYFGTVYEPVYLAGIAAGSVTKTKTLGYIYAFPIPQTLANINAFTLGAQSVDPSIKVNTVATGSWCDPSVQAGAVKSLLDQKADVITQHQDCTKTIIEATEAAGAYSVGYHADASSLAPKGWITGSEWNWGPLYTDIVKTVLDGKFKTSPYNGDYRVGLQTGTNPFVQSPYGSMVTDATKALIDAAKARFVAGGSPFEGPVDGQDGKEIYKKGSQPTYDEVEQMDFFVKGVVGSIK
jgi:basic membrane protein A